MTKTHLFLLHCDKLLSLTNTTDDIFTLLDGAGSEHHTAEASRLRGFWGVSVNRTNHVLR